MVTEFEYVGSMFDEPNEEDTPAESAQTPQQRAQEKVDEFRMHAELCAVFEGARKFDAEVRPGLDANLARDVQRTIGKLEKAKSPDNPVVAPDAAAGAISVLTCGDDDDIGTNHYHISRRPGEVMILRWLAGEQVATFYDRLQAHFDAALKQYREEERQSHGWKQDESTTAYLDALDELKFDMSERYLREPVREEKLFVLSTQTADEMDILHLSFIMNVEPAEIVGDSLAPGDAPTEQDRAWFFKLFSLRGVVGGEERMCFFTYMQKADDLF